MVKKCPVKKTFKPKRRSTRRTCRRTCVYDDVDGLDDYLDDVYDLNDLDYLDVPVQRYAPRAYIPAKQGVAEDEDRRTLLQAVKLEYALKMLSRIFEGIFKGSRNKGKSIHDVVNWTSTRFRSYGLEKIPNPMDTKTEICRLSDIEIFNHETTPQIYSDGEDGKAAWIAGTAITPGKIVADTIGLPTAGIAICEPKKM